MLLVKSRKKRDFLLLFLVVMIILLIPLRSTSCGGDLSEGIGDNYTYIDEGAYSKYISPHRAGEPEIPCTVISYVFNDQYIIAIQKPNKACSSTVDIGNSYNFWIINQPEKNLIGPLSLEDYLKKRQELGIPEDLKVELNV